MKKLVSILLVFSLVFTNAFGTQVYVDKDSKVYAAELNEDDGVFIPILKGGCLMIKGCINLIMWPIKSFGNYVKGTQVQDILIRRELAKLRDLRDKVKICLANKDCKEIFEKVTGYKEDK